MSEDEKIESEKKNIFTGAVQHTSSDDYAPGRLETIIKASKDRKD